MLDPDFLNDRLRCDIFQVAVTANRGMPRHRHRDTPDLENWNGGIGQITKLPGSSPKLLDHMVCEV